MAINYLSLVNQKLAYARALLNSAAVLPSLPDASGQLQQHALLDGTVFHLICGYHHYLREIAANYGVKHSIEIKSEEELSVTLLGMDKTPCEVAELELLRRTPASWLAQLHHYYETLWRLPDPFVGVTDVSKENLIQAISLDTDGGEAVPLTIDAAIAWERAFSALVARQRETSAEY